MANRAGAEGAAAAVVIPAGNDRELAVRNLFLDAARVLMLSGAVATIGATTSAEPMLVFLSLFLWLLGVCLLALAPAAGRLQHAAMAATAMAITILKHLFTLWN